MLQNISYRIPNNICFFFIMKRTTVSATSSGQFHPIFKESTISPLFKKCTLDKDQLSNYRPISNLCLISVTVTVTVTEVFILRFLLKDRKCITESFTYIQRSPG